VAQDAGLDIDFDAEPDIDAALAVIQGVAAAGAADTMMEAPEPPELNGTAVPARTVHRHGGLAGVRGSRDGFQGGRG
jgi:hypothetical protein